MLDLSILASYALQPSYLISSLHHITMGTARISTSINTHSKPVFLPIHMGHALYIPLHFIAFLNTMPPRRVAADEVARKTAPRGHFVVYVGNEMRRFVVPTSFLKSPLFREQLDKAAEEYGFDNNSSRIALPCDVLTFTQLISILQKS